MKSSHLPLYQRPLVLPVMLACSLAVPAAGQSAPESSLAGPDAAVMAVVTKAKAGDSLDKLISAQYRNSPLRMDVLRGAVLSANPNLRDTGARLKVGQEIVLPAHKDIVVSVLGPLMPAAAPDGVSMAWEPMQRRDWIRYP